MPSLPLPSHSLSLSLSLPPLPPQLRPDSRIIGEGLSVLWLADAAPGFGGPGLKPLLRVPPNASAEVRRACPALPACVPACDRAPACPVCPPHPLQVWIADISLWNSHCNNTGALMLEWGAGPASGVWDFVRGGRREKGRVQPHTYAPPALAPPPPQNMLLSFPVGLKLAVAGEGGAGAGYLSNLWFCAVPNYVLAAAASAAAALAPPGSPALPLPATLLPRPEAPACSPNMPTGVNISSVRVKGGRRGRGEGGGEGGGMAQ